LGHEGFEGCSLRPEGGQRAADREGKTEFWHLTPAYDHAGTHGLTCTINTSVDSGHKPFPSFLNKVLLPGPIMVPACGVVVCWPMKVFSALLPVPKGLPERRWR